MDTQTKRFESSCGRIATSSSSYCTGGQVVGGDEYIFTPSLESQLQRSINKRIFSQEQAALLLRPAVILHIAITMLLLYFY